MTEISCPLPQKDSRSILITAVMADDAFDPPKELRVGDHTIHLQDYGKACGMDKDGNVYFRFVKSGTIETGAINDVARAKLQPHLRACSTVGCTNQTLEGPTCWKHPERSDEMKLTAAPPPSPAAAGLLQTPSSTPVEIIQHI
jgi:hypothetical protein